MWEKEKGAKSEELLKQEVDNYLEKIFNSSTQLDYSLETLDNERANKE